MRHLLKIAASSLLRFGMAAAPAMAGDHDRRGGYGHHDRDHDDGDDRRRHRHDRYDARYDRHAYRYDRYDRRYDRRAPRVVYVQPRVVYRTAPHPRWVRGGRYYGATSSQLSSATAFEPGIAASCAAGGASASSCFFSRHAA